jgi:hypothetical protein
VGIKPETAVARVVYSLSHTTPPPYNMRSGDTQLKKPPSKQDLRRRLSQQTAKFLSSGGSIQELARGESAYERNEIPPPAPLFTDAKVARTPLTDVVAALDARRAPKRQQKKGSRRSTPRQRKQVVYDDFGEPLRVVWVEDP